MKAALASASQAKRFLQVVTTGLLPSHRSPLCRLRLFGGETPRPIRRLPPSNRRRSHPPRCSFRNRRAQCLSFARAATGRYGARVRRNAIPVDPNRRAPLDRGRQSSSRGKAWLCRRARTGSAGRRVRSGRRGNGRSSSDRHVRRSASRGPGRLRLGNHEDGPFRNASGVWTWRSPQRAGKAKSARERQVVPETASRSKFFEFGAIVPGFNVGHSAQSCTDVAVRRWAKIGAERFPPKRSRSI